MQDNNNSLNKAADYIKSGKLVAFPTETVYGLGASAFNQEACLKIFKTKNRPFFNPLIIHISSNKIAEDLAYFSPLARIIAANFWPGPLTMVLPLNDKYKNIIAPAALANLSTIALRFPSSLIAQQLINRSQVPIAAPSANPSGYISSTFKKHVSLHFSSDEKQIYILDDEPEKTSLYGIESTIIDLTKEDEIKILRQGFITEENIRNILPNNTVRIFLYDQINEIGAENISNNKLIKAPGMLKKHYAPKTKIMLNILELSSYVQEKFVALNFSDSKLIGRYNLNLSKQGDLIEAAKNLYSMLIELDIYAQKNKIPLIAVAPIPNIDVGAAINDRLERACAII